MTYEDELASVLSTDLLNYAPYYTFCFAALGLIVADDAMVTPVLTILGSLKPAAALTVALVYRACTYWVTIVVGGTAAGVLLLRDS